MMKTYTHLTRKDRYTVAMMIKQGFSQISIADALERSPSTISREIKRNKGQRGYRYKQAVRLTSERHPHKPKAIKMTEVMKNALRHYLDQD